MQTRQGRTSDLGSMRATVEKASGSCGSRGEALGPFYPVDAFSEDSKPCFVQVGIADERCSSNPSSPSATFAWN